VSEQEFELCRRPGYGIVELSWISAPWTLASRVGFFRVRVVTPCPRRLTRLAALLYISAAPPAARPGRSRSAARPCVRTIGLRVFRCRRPI